MTDFTYHGHDIAHSMEADLLAAHAFVEPSSIKSAICVGACCGYEAAAIRTMYPAIPIHLIEGCQETYDLFLGRERSCCPVDAVTACAAFSDTEGEAVFHLAGLNTQHSLLVQKDSGGPESSRPIQTTTMESYCSKAGIRPDLIMLDVEGVPLRVMRGAGNDILDNMKIVIAETEPRGANVFEGGDTDEDFNSFMNDCGLVRIRTSAPHRPIRQLNCVWVRL